MSADLNSPRCHKIFIKILENLSYHSSLERLLIPTNATVGHTMAKVVRSVSMNSDSQIKSSLPLVEQALDPGAPARVVAPGVGVIITRSTNIEFLVRESVNIAQVRGRLLYVILIDDEIGNITDPDSRWENEVYRIAHNFKADRIKLNRANIEEQLHNYCVQFDIRLLLVEQQKKCRLPWSSEESVIDKIANSPKLPVTFSMTPKVIHQSAVKRKMNFDWLILISTLIAVSLLTAWARDQIPKAFHLLTFILALAILSNRISLIASIAGSFLAMICFKLAHIAPFGSFAFEDPRQWLNLVGLVTVSLIINTLSWQVKSSLQEAQTQERRKTALFNLTRDLLKTASLEEIAGLAEAHIRDVIKSDIALFVQFEASEIKTVRHGNVSFDISAEDLRARDICLNQGIEAGIGTQICPLAYGLYLPILPKEAFHGCLAVYPGGHRGVFPPDQLRTLDTFSRLIGLAFERIGYEAAQREADRQIRDTNLQNTLLRSVSHDLKTPLTSITGYANQLAENPDMPVELRVETYATIRDQAWRLTNLINNLLSITKLESEHLELDSEPMFVEELIGTAVGQMRPRLINHKLRLEIDSDIDDVAVDPLIFNQALVNLIENAVKYTPEGSAITIRSQQLGDHIQISVIDEGPGLPTENIESVFEKFTRFDQGRKVEGTGLGLAIVKAVVELHGGTVTSRNRPNRGAQFDIQLPAIEPVPDKEKI